MGGKNEITASNVKSSMGSLTIIQIGLSGGAGPRWQYFFLNKHYHKIYSLSSNPCKSWKGHRQPNPNLYLSQRSHLSTFALTWELLEPDPLLALVEDDRLALSSTGGGRMWKVWGLGMRRGNFWVGESATAEPWVGGGHILTLHSLTQVARTYVT